MAGGKEGGEVTKEDFLLQFQVKYVVGAIVSMTDTLVVKGSKPVRKLEVNEVVEALEEPTKDEALGVLRVKAKAEKDGKVGYITFAGNQGTVYLEDYSPFVACERRVQQSIKDMYDVISQTGRFVDSKIGELKNVTAGPLSDTKGELAKLKPR